MKRLSRSTPLVIAAVLVLVLAALSFWTPAPAQLGNVGVPVQCSAVVISAPQVFTCAAADGTAFVNNRVPTGYYLHVTDVIIAPNTTADTQAIIEAEDANNATAGSFFLQTSSFASQGQHFTTPALVLHAQFHLRAVSFTGTSYSAEVSGLLTRNVTYMPLIVR